MSRPKQDPVDRLLDVWLAATPEQRNEALRTIKRLETRGCEQSKPQKPGRRPAKKTEQAPEAQP